MRLRAFALTCLVALTGVWLTEPASAASPGVRPMCPGAPASPPLSITNASRTGADLTWSAVPGAARYGYRFSYLTAGGWTPFPDWTFVTTPTPIRVQRDGATAFAYAISAQSSCGTGFAQGSCLAGDPGTCTRIALSSRPAAPAAPTAAYAAGVLGVSWAPPTDDGGSPITGYQVTATPGGPVCSVAATTCQPDLPLPAGTQVTFTVLATNAAGSSDPSPASSPITLLGGPAAPGRVQVGQLTSTSATVTWAAAAADEGAAPRYVVTARPGGRTCQSTGLSCRVTGLKAGTSYRFEVVARIGERSSDPTTSEAVRLPDSAASRPSSRPAPRPAPRPEKPTQNLS